MVIQHASVSSWENKTFPVKQSHQTKQPTQDIFSACAIREPHRKCLKKTISRYNIHDLQVTSTSATPKWNNTVIILGRARLCQKLGCCETVLSVKYEADRVR